MESVPTYGKILTIGAAMTENALVGSVIVQEKVDGSLFGFGLNGDRQLVARSKGAIIDLESPDNMFQEAVDYIKGIEDKIKKSFQSNVFFYCEYLRSPKHNVLKYDRTPTNHLVLFDCLADGQYLSREHLEQAAKELGIDVIPQLYVGKATTETIQSLLSGESYLGNEIVEGVVIKNYAQTILLGGNVYPLFTKYVREAFKERHQTEWKYKTPKASMDLWVDGFRVEARWQKAFQYLRDKGEIEQSPKDIGKLLKRVHTDIVEEEKENIKNELYKMVIEKILRVSTRGLAEWYKGKLLENLE